MRLAQLLGSHACQTRWLIMRCPVALALILVQLSCDSFTSIDGTDPPSGSGSHTATGFPEAPAAYDGALTQLGACCFGADCEANDTSCCRELQSDYCVAEGGVFIGPDTGCDIEVCDVLAVIARELDIDGDGVLDSEDNDVDGDGIPNGEDPDVDGDGIPNGEDSDVDGDGIENGEDPDIDGDGIENGKDTDADGDGLDFAQDDDDDGDGIPDNVDNDDDADGKKDCECKNDGDCFNEKCFCKPGWKGASCEQFHCDDVRNCNSPNGTCVGPNTCRCNQGWETHGSGGPCNFFHCRDLRECNGHGTCVGPAKCECDADWQGLEDCSLHTCDRNHTLCNEGPDPCMIYECDPRSGCVATESVPCPLFEECVNGTCTTLCTNASDCDNGRGCKDGGCFDCESDADCRDSDPCTIDECDSQFGCTNDLVPCPLFQWCVRGVCADVCDANGNCDTGFTCKDDLGCLKDCDDQNRCATDEICDDGVCVRTENDTEADNP